MDGGEELCGIAAPGLSGSYTIPAVARTCRKRARQRQELAQMAACDLADFRGLPGMTTAEASRWPWQRPRRS